MIKSLRILSMMLLVGVGPVLGLDEIEDLTYGNVKVLDEALNKILPCSEFAVSNEEVLSFFRNAEKIEGHQLHHEYYQYHCALEGEVKVDDQMCSFYLRAGGSAVLDCPQSGSFYIGCEGKCCVDSQSICMGE